jgi:hypothetical protein
MDAGQARCAFHVRPDGEGPQHVSLMTNRAATATAFTKEEKDEGLAIMDRIDAECALDPGSLALLAFGDR